MYVVQIKRLLRPFPNTQYATSYLQLVDWEPVWGCRMKATVFETEEEANHGTCYVQFLPDDVRESIYEINVIKI